LEMLQIKDKMFTIQGLYLYELSYV